MKKSISTLFSFMALLLFLSPTLSAQQINTDKKEDLIIIHKATDKDGVVEVDQLSLKKGEKFKAYVDQLNLAKMDGKEIKIEVFSSEDGVMTIDDNQEEETIFMFKAAKSTHDQNHEEVEKLIITLNDELAKEIEEDAKAGTIVNKKPLLGVYSETVDQGVLITGIVVSSGAQKAGIKKGDIITSLNNQTVSSSDQLSEVILNHQVGETITVDYIRDGVPGQLSATLGSKKARKRYFTHTRHNFDHDEDYYYNSFQERDPCKVFIGVYTSNSGKGLKVHNIIANTPAEKSNVQVGDRIVAIDDVEVTTHEGLIGERDKHQAGEFFTLSIIRDGKAMEVDAQFEACPTEAVKETVEEVAPVEEVVQQLEVTKNTLELESISVFPNPTYGPVNLKFKGEAKPTTIRVVDTAGKVVYEEVLNSFDGVYNNTLEFKRPNPGTMVITVQQGQKVYSQSLIFMLGA